MYDAEVAEKAVEWFPKYLKHTKGRWAGLPFELLPWQADVVRKLFGTLREDGTRQYRHIYIEIPKKNGKSAFAAAVALRLLFADGEPAAEIYSAAADRDQASIVYSAAREMIEISPALGKRCKIIDSTKRVIHNNGSFYRVLSSDAYTKHGYNVHAAIIDELHAHPGRELYEVLTQGSGDARTQPVFLTITTAGVDRNSICWEVHEYARQVRDGIIEDPTFLPVLFYADDDDDWTDETVWAKANPSLGHIINIESVREQCRRAQNSPQLENSFRRLRLNQWVKQENRYIPMSAWDDCEPRPALEEYRGKVFYAGLDLASSTDIAAFVPIHLDDQGNFNCFPYFWVPEEQIEQRTRRDRVPYDVWVREGYITATPGNVIDYEFIRHQMIDFGSEYELREVAYDRWGALQLMQQLEEDGLTVFPMGQGYASMSSPTKELLKIVLSQKLRHGGNPVLRWMADNLVTTSDPADNVKPDKSKSTERIDGMVALIMAIDRAIRHKDESTSVYEDEGMLVL